MRVSHGLSRSRLACAAAGASDALLRQCAAFRLSPSATRDRLTSNLFPGQGNDGIARLERAFDLEAEAAPFREKMKTGALAAAEEQIVQNADRAAADVIAVDDFSAEDLLREERK